MHFNTDIKIKFDHGHCYLTISKTCGNQITYYSFLPQFNNVNLYNLAKTHEEIITTTQSRLSSKKYHHSARQDNWHRHLTLNKIYSSF